MPAHRKQPPASNGNPLINNDRLKQLYASMLQSRMLAEKLRELLAPGKLASSAPFSFGHEATVAGVVSHLRPEDALAPAPGDLIPGFLKGASLDSLLSTLAGSSSNGHGTANGHGSPSLNLIPFAAGQTARLNIATGAALACKMLNNARVVVAFVAEESEPVEEWRETLQFAVANDLPIVYVTQTNLTADGSGSFGHADQNFAGHSLPLSIIPVDGHDVVAVYRVAQESIIRARQGSGPTLIEARACRSSQTSLNGNHTAAASSAGVPDAIANMEAYLSAKGLFSMAWKRQVEDKFRLELAAAVKSAMKARTLARRRPAGAPAAAK